MAATFRSMEDALASSADSFGLNLLEVPCRNLSTDGVVSDSRLMKSPVDSDLRPFDLWKATGEADPVEFERPRFGRGCRVKVRCFIPETQKYEVLSNVLVDKCLSAEYAYFPIPFTKAKKTIMGYVKICAVLKLQGSTDISDSPILPSMDSIVEGRVFELTDQKVAIKVNLVKKMEKLKDSHAEDPLKEIAAMQLMDGSPHVLGCSAVLYDDSAEVLNVVMKYCPHGDLFQILEKVHLSSPDQVRGLSEPQARYWFKQVLVGIQSIHRRGVFHRDLSPENILMDHNQCFIIDFGMALRVPYKEPLTGNIIAKKKHSCKCLFLPQGCAGKLPYMVCSIGQKKQQDLSFKADKGNFLKLLILFSYRHRKFTKIKMPLMGSWWTCGLPVSSFSAFSLGALRTTALKRLILSSSA